MSGRRILPVSKRIILTLLVAALLGVILAVFPGCGVTNPVAQTTYGKIQGQVGPQGILAFKGIPYARPPVGELRWKPPQPPEPWSGTLMATQYGPVAPQTVDALEPSSGLEQSEDCLSLNVWTPGVDEKRRPVMVWIHGGGWRNGSSADESYEGWPTAKRGDVVVVSMNYRLGTLGFLYLGGVGGPQYAESGNLGILDQEAVLKWVRDNIAAFGGDPGNVTVFGESAGSMSVCTLMSMDSAKGLFRRAIGESGALNTIRSIGYASEVTNRFMAMAGVTDMTGLQSLTTEQIVKAQGDLMAGQFQADTLFGPLVDATALPEPPLHAIASGSAKDVDFLTGTNLDEVRLWAFYIPGLLEVPIQTAVQYMPMLSKSLGTYVERIAASYKSRRPTATDGDITMAVGTDVIFRVPAIRVAEVQSALQPKTYMYLFTWPTPVQGGIFGSCHSLELFFVLDRLHAGNSVAVLGNDPPQKLADMMQDSWIAFAKTGNPNNTSIPNWPAYNTRTRATMIFNVNPLVQNDPYGEDRLVWDGIPFDSVTPSPSF